MPYLGDSKWCPGCRKYHPLADFPKNKNAKNGINTGSCKAWRNNRYRKYRSRIDRFWKFYHSHTVRNGDCLEWLGTCDPKPRYRLHGKKEHVPRLVYRLACGEIPNGMVVLHSCGNKQCVRHSHLKLGSEIDLLVKRSNCAPVGDRNGSRTKPERLPRGEHHSRHTCPTRNRLNEDDVRVIRNLYAQGVRQREIAIRFGVHYVTIFDVVHGKTWAHVQ